MQRKAAIPTNWNVPDLFRKRLGDVAGRQRVMSTDGHLLLILHELPSEKSAERNLRLFWRDADGAWKSDCFGDGVAALKSHLTQYAKAVDELDRQEHDATGPDDYFRIRHAIAPLRRAAHNMHDALMAGQDAVPDDRELISCCNQAGTIERAADLVHEDSQHGLQYAMAKQSEQQALASHRLNILVALFFPVATIAAVFSMKLASGLEGVMQPWLFWVVLGFGLVMGLVVRSFVAPTPSRAKINRYDIQQTTRQQST